MKKTRVVLRLSLSIVLLGYIISTLDFGAMREVLAEFHPAIYAAGFAFLLISQLSHAFLLNALMGSRHFRTAAMSTFKALSVATFFGMFLPGGGGPDIMLAYNLSKNAARKEKPLSAIVLARVLILSAAIFTALILSLAEGSSLKSIRNIFIFAAAALLASAFLTLNSKTTALSAKLFSFLKKNRWTHLIYKTYFVISGYRTQKRLLLKSLPLALLTSASRITVDYTIAKSLGLDIPAQYFFILVPLVSIAALVPVSISGIGVREGTYVGLFAIVGVGTAEAFSISVLTFSTGILFALIGAVLYVAGGAATKPPGGEAHADS